MAQNIDVREDGDYIVVKMKKTADFGKSVSGKSIIVASTNGAMAVGTINGEPLMLNVNMYRRV